MKKVILTAFCACFAACAVFHAYGEESSVEETEDMFTPPEFKYTPGSVELICVDDNGNTVSGHGTFDPEKGWQDVKFEYSPPLFDNDGNNIIPPFYSIADLKNDPNSEQFLEAIEKIAEAQANIDVLKESVESLNEKVNSLHGEQKDEDGEDGEDGDTPPDEVKNVEEAVDENAGTECTCKKKLDELENNSKAHADAIIGLAETAAQHTTELSNHSDNIRALLADYNAEKTARTSADANLANAMISLHRGSNGEIPQVSTNLFATVAFSGSYDDLTDKPNDFTISGESGSAASIKSIVIREDGTIESVVNTTTYTNGLFAGCSESAGESSKINLKHGNGVDKETDNELSLVGTSLKLDTYGLTFTNGFIKEAVKQKLSVNLSSLVTNVTAEVIEQAIADSNLQVDFAGESFTNAVHAVESDPVWAREKSQYLTASEIENFVASAIDGLDNKISRDYGSIIEELFNQIQALEAAIIRLQGGN